jgi:hypothetical protein
LGLLIALCFPPVMRGQPPPEPPAAGKTTSPDAPHKPKAAAEPGPQQWRHASKAAVKEASRAFAAQFTEAAALTLDPQPVQELAFNDGGKLLAIGLINTPRSLHVLDVETGKARPVALSDDETERHVEALAFAGGRLVVGGGGFDRKRVEEERGQGRPPDFSPGRVTEGKLRLIDPASGAVATTLRGHIGYTTDAVAAGDVLYSVGTDNFVRAWKVGGGADPAPAMLWERNFGQLGAPYGVAVAGDVVVVASPLSVITLTDRQSGRALGNVSFLTSRLTSPLVGLSNTGVALGAFNQVKLLDLSTLPPPPKGVDPERTVRYDVPERALSEEWLGFSRVNDLAAAPAADLLVSGDGVPRPGSIADPPHGPGVRFWRAGDGDWLGWLPAQAPVTAVALSQDARLLAIGDVKGRVIVYRLPRRLEPARLGAPAGSRDTPDARR